jgi:hypothetical protein
MILKLIPSEQIANGTKQRRYKVRPQKNRLTRERLRVKAEWKAYVTVRKTDKRTYKIVRINTLSKLAEK